MQMNYPFLGRNLVCKCGQISWAVIYKKAEVLTSQANFGNNQSASRNGERA